MKRKIITALLVPAVLLSVFAYRYIEEVSGREKEKVVGQSVMLALNSAHYLQLELDDAFSETVFETYLKSLDSRKNFLLQEDIESLSAYKLQLDEHLKQTDLSFFNRSYTLIEKRIPEAAEIYEEILSEPFDFEVDEEIQLDPEKRDFAEDREALRERWRKALKYQVMVHLKTQITKQEDALEREDTAWTEESFEEMEAASREHVLERQKNYFNNLGQIERKDRFAAYYNAVASAFGPHSGYFPPKDRENFNIRMSGKLEGIGAQLTRRDGYINVTRIVPGSASWKQGDLKAGDKIIKVAQEGEEPVDVVGMRLDDVVELIRGEKGTVVSLTVEKPDGSIEEISIERDVVMLEETYARSAILKDEDESYKAGYINLPKFYVDFEDEEGRRCSEDVAKELEKMKDENMDGLILDLRNNGGGSLPDVVKIAGLFIEKGPIVQIKAKHGRSKVLEDESEDIHYDGPLLILVNRGSASASEIMAAAMQDYGRAVVVGGSATFGKGTVQRFFDLDQVIRNKEIDKYKPLGSVKLTTQKFYRINGGSTQLKGVEPDIELPDRYTYIEVGEREMENAMPWTKTDPLEYTDKWKETYDLNKLRKNSRKRIKDHNVFNLIEEDAKRVKENRKNTTKTLNLKEFTEEQEELQQKSEKVRKARNKERPIHITQLSMDYENFAQDTVKMQRFENWQDDLQKDVHLEEALYILKDTQR
ncbi:MAG: carboxy terminal-processing peptidase [Bacteroidales bacterium]